MILTHWEKYHFIHERRNKILLFRFKQLYTVYRGNTVVLLVLLVGRQTCDLQVMDSSRGYWLGTIV